MLRFNHKISHLLKGFFVFLASLSVCQMAYADEPSLFHTYLSQYKETLCKVQESAAKKNLSEISKAIERTAKANNGSYPLKEEDFSGMYPANVGDKFNQNTVKGYVYDFQLNAEGYTVRAIPAACGVTGKKVFQVQTGGKISEQPCQQLEQMVSGPESPGPQESQSGPAPAEVQEQEPLPEVRSYVSPAYHYEISVPEGWTIVSRDHFQQVDPSLMNSAAEVIVLHQQGKAWGMIIPEKVSVPFNLNSAKERLLENLQKQSLEVIREAISFDYGDGALEVQWRVSQGDVRHNYMILFVVFEGTGLQMMAWTLESDAEQTFAQLKEIMRGVTIRK